MITTIMWYDKSVLSMILNKSLGISDLHVAIYKNILDE